jgi:hypothetical protein
MKQLKPLSELERSRPTFLLLGLCITLLAVYGLFEMKTVRGIENSIPDDNNTTQDVFDIPRTYKKQPQKAKPIEDQKKIKKKTFTELFIEVPNNMNVPNDEDEPLDVIDDGLGYEEPTITVNIEMLDKKPVFPGCEDILNEKERFACFQSKMTAFVATRFKPCESTFGVSKEKIFVMFTIDEFGRVGNAEVARSTDECNSQNAIKVMGQLPTMTPGMFMDKKVKTRFVLPINIR